MKFKYFFTAVVILIILFSMGMAVASENMTYDVSSADVNSVINVSDDDPLDADSNDELYESQSSNNETISSDENENGIDLSVRIDVNNTFEGNKYNQVGFKVPWTITAKVSGGKAYNIKVYQILSDNMEYVSHNLTVGKYDSVNRIWHIDELDSSNKASLTILTKLKSGDRFTYTVNATADSKDIDLSNNNRKLSIKSGTSKSTSNYTETTTHKNESHHDGHYGSEVNRGFAGINRGHSQGNSNRVSSNGGSKSESNKNLKSSSRVSASFNSKTKNALNKNYLRTVTDAISNVYEHSVNSDSIKDTQSNSKNNSSTETVDGIYAYDYVKIPIVIFSLFLIILVGILAYDKVKS